MTPEQIAARDVAAKLTKAQQKKRDHALKPKKVWGHAKPWSPERIIQIIKSKGHLEVDPRYRNSAVRAMADAMTADGVLTRQRGNGWNVFEYRIAERADRKILEGDTP